MSTRAEKLAFAEEMIALVEDQIKATVGVTGTSTDGVTVSIDPTLNAQLEYWRKQAQRYARDKSRTANIDVSGAHD